MRTWGRTGNTLLVAVAVVVGLVGAGDLGAAPMAYAPSPIAGWSTNGPVLAVKVVGNTVYAGGNFTEVRGPGGTPVVARSRLAAFDAQTGALRTDFVADADGPVESLASDGTRLFVGGDFLNIKGVARSRLASLSLTTGNVNNGFFTGASSHVYALAVKGDRLYVGGSFNILGSTTRSRIGALNTANSAVDPTFNPNANVDGTVRGIAVSPDGTTVYAGGVFTSIGGGTRSYVAPLSATTGFLQPVAFDYPLFTNPAHELLDLDLSPAGDRLVAALGGAENQVVSWSTATGARQWSYQVDGDVQAVRSSGGNVYFGFHQGDIGDPTVRLLVADAATGTVSPYRPALNSFFGVWDIDASADVLAVGGEFTNFNGVAVQGFAILPRTTSDTAAPTPPGNLRATASTAASITLAWDPGTDDTGVGAYRVLRNGLELAYPTGTTFTDTGLAAATDYTYTVQTVDTAGNVSTSSPAVVAGTDIGLVASGAAWRYTDDGVERGTAWKERTFDDTTWKTGNAELGYGDGGEATVMFNGGTVPAQRSISHYLRRSFTVTNAATVSGLTVSVLRDDGVVVYVNGTEAFRDNMPAGTITSTTLALNAQFDAAETTFFDFTVPPSLLVEGTNVIAVSVHNESRQGTGDLSFDARVSAKRLGGGPTAPAAPTNLRSTGVTTTTASLAWDAPAGDVTGYRVSRNGALVGSPTTTSFTDAGLTGGQTYSYTVTAVNGALESLPTAPLAVATTAPTGPTTETLFPSGSAWRYTDDGVERGTAWKERTFDDTTWKTGNAELGYGDGGEATVMFNGGTVPLQRWISHYLRRSFTVTNASQVTGLTLSVLRDDGVVVYVNGTEVVRDNMPAGTITSTTLALNAQFDAAETTFFDFTVPPSLLVEGTNVVAVSVHNESRQGAGDLSFNARLVAQRHGGGGGGDTTAPTAPQNLRTTARGATQVTLAWNASTDDVGVTGYVVSRNGVDLPVTSATTLVDALLAPGAAYSYTVRARDAAGNTSAPSGALVVTTHASTETVVAANTAWRYTDDGIERGTAWRETAYDDSTWKIGNAQLGYGDGDEATAMFNGGTVPLQRWISHYVRRSFTVTDVAGLTGATISVLRDDGVVIYVNGVELTRDNMPTGTISSTTFALNAQFDAAETTYFDFAIPPSLLVEGTNVIAISVHNESRQGAGDLSFDARVSARYA